MSDGILPLIDAIDRNTAALDRQTTTIARLALLLATAAGTEILAFNDAWNLLAATARDDR